MNIRDENDYSNMTELEHILNLPDMYLGSSGRVHRKVNVYDFHLDKIVSKDVKTSYVLENIFREPINNIGDNAYESRKRHIDPIRADIYIYNDHIMMRNYGFGIPVRQKEFKIDEYNFFVDWIPTQIFSKFRSSSNYNDNRCTSGRNGYGVTLTGAFSNIFQIDISDGVHNFKQSWVNNLQTQYDPIITPSEGFVYTTVTFYPELSRMGYDSPEFNEEDIMLFCMHCLDLSYYSDMEVHVFLENKYSNKIISFDVRNAIHYFEYYTKTSIKTKYIHYTDKDLAQKINYTTTIKGKRNTFDLIFELLIVDIPKDIKYSDDQIFTTLVNGIRAEEGIQIDAVYDLFPTEDFKRKTHKARIFHHVAVILKLTLVNPSSTGQTKSKLTGPKFVLELPRGHTFKDWEFLNELKRIKKDDNTKKLSVINSDNINIYDVLKGGALDSYYAGSRNSASIINAEKSYVGNFVRVLALTEGKSAKTYVELLLDNIEYGRRLWGILPLKGKIINVRKAFGKGKFEKICENKEIKTLVSMLGLKFNMTYEHDVEVRTLRYDKIMCFFDSDNDGFHIMMLAINFLDFFFPHLLNRRGFLNFYCTPVVKLCRGNSIVDRFYTNHHYEMFIQINPKHNFTMKYFKGLGRSVASDVRDNMNHEKILRFYYSNTSRDMIDMIMGKSSSSRKDWIVEDIPKIDTLEQLEDISMFIDVNVRSYSLESIVRSTPGMDGLKESQRMLLLTMLEDTKYSKSSKTRKMANFSSMTAYLREYHHGEDSLANAAALMCQDFPCSNNLKYFIGEGNMGSRSSKDNIPKIRYLEIRDNPLIAKIFRYEDKDIILKNSLCPIIPNILVNGAMGIGTAWSTNIPGFSLTSVLESTMTSVEYLIYKLESHENIYHVGIEMEILESYKYEVLDCISLIPECRNFRGTINMYVTPVETINKYRQRILDRTIEFNKSSQNIIYIGGYTIINAYEYNVYEIPPKYTFDKYHKHLYSLKEKGILTDIINDSSSEYINIIVRFSETYINQFTDQESYLQAMNKIFLCTQNYSMDNMNILDENNNVKNFYSVEHIFIRYMFFRLESYVRRMKMHLDDYNAEISVLENKLKFITFVNTSKIKLNDLTKAEIVNYANKFGVDKSIVSSIKIIERSSDKISKLKDRINKLKLKYSNIYDGKNNCLEIWLKELYELKIHIENFPEHI